MSDVPFTRKQLLEVLNWIAEGQNTAEELTTNLRVALLDFVSDTS